MTSFASILPHEAFWAYCMIHLYRLRGHETPHRAHRAEI